VHEGWESLSLTKTGGGLCEMVQKKKKMVIDFSRSTPLLLTVSIEGINVEMLSTHKYLVLHSSGWNRHQNYLIRLRHR